MSGTELNVRTPILHFSRHLRFDKLIECGPTEIQLFSALSSNICDSSRRQRIPHFRSVGAFGSAQENGLGRIAEHASDTPFTLKP
jgi:hypothetical protein